MLDAADEARIMVCALKPHSLGKHLRLCWEWRPAHPGLPLSGFSQYEDGVRTGRRVAGSATTPLEHYFLSTDPSFTVDTQVVNLALAELLLVSKIPHKRYVSLNKTWFGSVFLKAE